MSVHTPSRVLGPNFVELPERAPHCVTITERSTTSPTGNRRIIIEEKKRLDIIAFPSAISEPYQRIRSLRKGGGCCVELRAAAAAAATTRAVAASPTVAAGPAASWIEGI